MSTQLAKPVLRGHHIRSATRRVYTSVLVGISAGLAWKFLYADKVKEKYAEFYRTYDVKADYERMKKKGIFQGIDPDE